jgi:predicted kinase
VISLDALRGELDISPAADQKAVLQAVRQRARELLREGRSFAWNATNVSRHCAPG